MVPDCLFQQRVELIIFHVLVYFSERTSQWDVIISQLWFQRTPGDVSVSRISRLGKLWQLKMSSEKHKENKDRELPISNDLFCSYEMWDCASIFLIVIKVRVYQNEYYNSCLTTAWMNFSFPTLVINCRNEQFELCTFFPFF